MQNYSSRGLEVRTTYIVYHIWLIRNRKMFEMSWQSARFILERTLVQARKIMDVLSVGLTSIAWDTSDSLTAQEVTYVVLVYHLGALIPELS